MAKVMTKWEQKYREELDAMTFSALWEHFKDDASQPDDYGEFTPRGATRYEICVSYLEKFFKKAGLC